MAKPETVRKATGREQAEWYRVLDRWGAPGRPYQEIAGWLTGEHGLSRWWAQKLIVEYEQDRGIRGAGARRDGSFEVGASKTLQVPVAQAFHAVVDGRRRKRWLTDGSMKLQASESNRKARFLWQDGSGRVTLRFEEKGPSKTLVLVAHDKLTNAQDAAGQKALWRQRLSDLKAVLEG